ncbi:photosynthetic complex assembly protein PuhC [Rhodoplanes sp. TEM]|uniref:Photosynthetic complex assembly protein PuhC n=1 Tax=Rhodoplanes tepidamans TaxID=200616 RepID=A0ABT5J4M0_RHOTP|nr:MULTISPECIES: photosynthetic complex assembly protein PuhC [Rhodoplanes]MDC7784585.1 photosynthetic complex assembly protein PuhC [Rhodoplanes tepidamans]MDC7982877.1 photosynthetic complex assembly protein PuhC [Rhodoplanes sp. TEM]MDQ0355813.1 putative photosynthetic complex assembly protein [Rhodoplanes tepidamans]
MSDLARRPFPRGPLLGAAALLVFVLVAVGVSRGVGTVPTGAPPDPAAAVAVAMRDLRFVDRPDGTVAVVDAADGRTVGALASGQDNFIRGTLRGFARERRRQDIGVELPFRLTRWTDGRLSLDDPSTGRHVELSAFGVTNAEAFGRFLQGRDGAR